MLCIRSYPKGDPFPPSSFCCYPSFLPLEEAVCGIVSAFFPPTPSTQFKFRPPLSLFIFAIPLFPSLSSLAMLPLPLSLYQSRLRWELATSVTLRYAIPFSSLLPSCEVVPTSTHLILSSHLVNTPHLHFQHRRQSPPSVGCSMDRSFERVLSCRSRSCLHSGSPR